MTPGRSARLLSVVALLVTVSAVPVQRAAACDCQVTALPDAIRGADVAFVGRLVAAGDPAVPAVPAARGPVLVPREWTWQIERTRDPRVGEQLTTSGWPDDGANCGVTFEAGERWLVLAWESEGRLETNGCARNHLMDGSDPEAEALIEELVALAAEPAAEADAPPIPAPVLLVLGVVGLLAGVAVLAFRATDRSSAR